ncbi:Hypothetical predicted protein [Paramuricea clavata]|uniref:Uncharacterized protein n=1 Tax=Paramuricea clavata TaxID=317549 RepID=A0A6S7FZU5_PARCT|nr:Hypothetical predicted protein [Paramuricea clavata]
MAIEESSKNSVITAMRQFIHSVDEMDSTVLVPRRLMDIPAVQLERAQVNKDNQEILQDNIDLFKFYTMLVETRDEMIWGGRSTDAESSSVCPIVKQLQQFARVLNDLTDMADQLKERYEYDINNIGSGRNSPS